MKPDNYTVGKFSPVCLQIPNFVILNKPLALDEEFQSLAD
jgi:hypothetical protein